MSDYSNLKKKGGKKTKTHVALQQAFLNMLNNRRFSKISVNDLCEAALLSRSTFYVYFDDKFDLLEYCMDELKTAFEVFAAEHTEKEIIEEINEYIYSNAKLLKNLLVDSNTEVMVLLLNILTTSLSGLLSVKEKNEEEMSLQHLVLANYCAGGIVNLLLWQVKNNFPVDKELMSDYLYKMLRGIEALDLEQTPKMKEE